jgi:exodeoxyribonuclease VII small subunit
MVKVQKSRKDSIEFLLEELKKISDRLESEGVSIDESIDLCEEGNELLVKCKEKLSQIKLKVYDFGKNEQE